MHVLHIGNKVANECWLVPNPSLRRRDIFDLRNDPDRMKEYILAKYTGKEFIPKETKVSFLSNRALTM